MTLSSPRTASPRRWPGPAGPPGGAYPRQLAEASAADRRAARARSIPGGWSTRAAAARRRCPGSPRTSATVSPSWPGRGPARSCWSRSASSPITWRSSSTSTWRRRGRPSGSGCRWRARRPRAPDPRFVAMITELVAERQARGCRPRRALGDAGADPRRVRQRPCCGAAAARPAVFRLTAAESRGPARPGLRGGGGGGPAADRQRRPPGGRGHQVEPDRRRDRGGPGRRVADQRPDRRGAARRPDPR